MSLFRPYGVNERLAIPKSSSAICVRRVIQQRSIRRIVLPLRIIGRKVTQQYITVLYTYIRTDIVIYDRVVLSVCRADRSFSLRVASAAGGGRAAETAIGETAATEFHRVLDVGIKYDNKVRRIVAYVMIDSKKCIPPCTCARVYGSYRAALSAGDKNVSDTIIRIIIITINNNIERCETLYWLINFLFRYVFGVRG